MSMLSVYIEGIGLLGPGLDNWSTARSVLAGERTYQYQPTVLPSPTALPAAERRRCGPVVKLALAAGMEAAAAAGQNPAQLPAVFSASGADGDNCHAICEMLASDDRHISPTRFHNSVHNAAAGYWSIATGAMTTSSALCAYDASFGTGLLEAVTQTVIDNTRVLLIACDTPYPEPLYSKRPVPDEFAASLLLAPEESERALARVSISLANGHPDCMQHSALEQMRLQIPAARCLPLLQLLARGSKGVLVLEYLDGCSLSVDVVPC